MIGWVRGKIGLVLDAGCLLLLVEHVAGQGGRLEGILLSIAGERKGRQLEAV
jgi:hypothetical protein